ncbi:hypothetical protein E1180_18705 [Roseibium denhamense]|nr:hypothetical protein [Roseibium denhamense]
MATTSRMKALVLLSVCLGLALGGCGRKGGLDTPGTAQPAAEGPVDPAVAPSQPPPQDDRSFPLDFLIK